MVDQNVSSPYTDKQVVVYPYSTKKYFFHLGKLRYVVILCFSLIMLIHNGLSGQVFQRKLSAGVHGGMLIFYGDIKTNEFMPALSGYNELRFGGGVQATYHLNPMLAMRGSILAGKLAGASPATNEYFNANILDYTLQIMVSLNKIIFYDYDITPVDVYLVGGYGLVEFRTIKRRLSDNSFVRAFGYNPDGSRSPRKTREMVLPVGIMIHSNIDNILRTNNHFLSNTDLTLEFMLHNANTNKLDADLTVRERKDKYSYFAIGLVYHLN